MLTIMFRISVPLASPLRVCRSPRAGDPDHPAAQLPGNHSCHRRKYREIITEMQDFRFLSEFRFFRVSFRLFQSFLTQFGHKTDGFRLFTVFLLASLSLDLESLWPSW